MTIYEKNVRADCLADMYDQHPGDNYLRGKKLPFSPFMTTQILEPTHLSMSSVTYPASQSIAFAADVLAI
jgi:hypothetical protein